MESRSIVVLAVLFAAISACEEDRSAVLERERESRRESVEKMAERTGGEAIPMSERSSMFQLTIENQREERALAGKVNVAVVRLLDVFEDDDRIPVVIARQRDYEAPHLLLRDESGIVDGLLESGDLKRFSRWTIAFKGEHSTSLEMTFRSQVDGVHEDEIETSIDSSLQARKIINGRLIEMSSE